MLNGVLQCFTGVKEDSFGMCHQCRRSLGWQVKSLPEELSHLAKASRAGGICAENGSMPWFIFTHAYSELGVIALLADVGTRVRTQTDGS